MKMSVGMLGHKNKHCDATETQRFWARCQSCKLLGYFLGSSHKADPSSLGQQTGPILFLDDHALVFEVPRRRELHWGSLACG
jgi:hypothetical protein